jgi:hypothetical protein
MHAAVRPEGLQREPPSSTSDRTLSELVAWSSFCATASLRGECSHFPTGAKLDCEPGHLAGGGRPQLPPRAPRLFPNRRSTIPQSSGCCFRRSCDRGRRSPIPSRLSRVKVCFAVGWRKGQTAPTQTTDPWHSQSFGERNSDYRPAITPDCAQATVRSPTRRSAASEPQREPHGLAAVRRRPDAAVPRTVEAQPLRSVLLPQLRVHATAELGTVASSANVLRPQDSDAAGRCEVEGAGNTRGSIPRRHDLHRRPTVRRSHRRRVRRRPAKAANEELHCCDRR